MTTIIVAKLGDEELWSMLAAAADALAKLAEVSAHTDGFSSVPAQRREAAAKTVAKLRERIDAYVSEIARRHNIALANEHRGHVSKH